MIFKTKLNLGNKEYDGIDIEAETIEEAQIIINMCHKGYYSLSE